MKEGPGEWEIGPAFAPLLAIRKFPHAGRESISAAAYYPIACKA